MTKLTDDELLAWLDGYTKEAARSASRAAPKLEQIATRFRELLALQEWQPIETAPTDSQMVLVAEKHSGFVGEARFIPEHGWYVANTDPTDYHDGACSPTHWRPRPDPPKDVEI